MSDGTEISCEFNTRSAVLGGTITLGALVACWVAYLICGHIYYLGSRDGHEVGYHDAMMMTPEWRYPQNDAEFRQYQEWLHKYDDCSDVRIGVSKP